MKNCGKIYIKWRNGAKMNIEHELSRYTDLKASYILIIFENFKLGEQFLIVFHSF